MKLTVKQSFRLGAILRKINLPLEEFKSIDMSKEGAAEKTGTLIIQTIVNNYANAENEVIDFLTLYKGVTKEEAENLEFVELINVFKEIMSQLGGNLGNFLASSSSQSGIIETSSNPDTTPTT